MIVLKKDRNMQMMPSEKTMYQALVNKDSAYEGVFFVGVKTTGIFCRPSCSARKPLAVNVEYFKNTSEALNAGYRPCKKCRPMEFAGSVPDFISTLLNEVESNPVRKWKDYELREKGYEPVKVRRWFQKNHGITFQAYLRAIRLGQAIGNIKLGENVTRTAFESGYESLSGFRDAFKKTIGTTPRNGRDLQVVFITRILTPVGPLVAGATDEGICLLEFTDRKMLETQFKRLVRFLDCKFVPGSNKMIEQLSGELELYFEGKLKSFNTPVIFPGTEFQQKVWKALLTIPYGQTRSYEEQAVIMGNPAAVRAVATANGDNRLSIIIPCHRVVGKNGELCGYGGGLWRKRFLLDLEKKNSD
jgi:AraC family transcriptional regulator, regulatory protein of adaptative response / methylated-DNA-[protein]-cysteine methyltransferase